jgi:septal ring factor EnvC (AmiA/AmiB activator)
MSMAFEKFAELETRILRTVELVKTTRQEKDALEKELAGSRSEIAALKRDLEELRRERDMVKNKVEALLESLAELEEPGVETETAAN